MERMISYAQNFEDVILNRLFDGQKSGFYIDIGASHPDLLSVTKHFYDKGWHGINVDPIPRSIDLFRKSRPNDINLQLAIGLQNGAVDFYEVDGYSEISSLKESEIDSERYKLISYQVQMITGNNLFASYVNQSVDFMKIDVEGAEHDVIKSIDFKVYRPKVLIVEATKPNVHFPGWADVESILTHHDWHHILEGANYIFTYFDGLNRFYIRSENADLIKYFQSGICLWDNYITSLDHTRILDLESQIHELTYHCEERMKQINTLSDMVGELQSQINHQANMESQIYELTYHCEERMKQINTLSDMVKKLKADN